MRSRRRDLQNIWICTVSEKIVNAITIKAYSKPIKYRRSVSATSGMIQGASAGFVLNYDRYITSYKRDFFPPEGTMVFVDVIPVVDEEGMLVISEDGFTPVTPPDYIINRIYSTQKGKADRFGIKKV